MRRTSKTDKSRLTEVQLQRILQTRRAQLDAIGRQLAMNFEIPSCDIIAMGCHELGISVADWHAIKSYEIEQAAQ